MANTKKKTKLDKLLAEGRKAAAELKRVNAANAKMEAELKRKAQRRPSRKTAKKR
jgi:hypothetical protein